MRYLLLTLVISVGLAAALPGSVAADLGLTQTTQAVLSCTDGHSVSLAADPSLLASLAADVQSINASGTGTTCSLDTAAAGPAAGADWTVYDYNRSGQEIAPRNSPNSHPATTTATTTMFDFLFGHYTALLTTNDKSLTGDLSATTLNDQIDVQGPATTFMTQHGGGDCVNNAPAAVRFFFVSPSASGTSAASPVGFYTQFWWSNPTSVQLINGNTSSPPSITASMTDPTEWSDWNGQRGDSSPGVFAAFEQASDQVQTIGLSFGGDCFFETGVKAVYSAPPPTYEQFSSNFTETP
jgi:hypothetical protein